MKIPRWCPALAGLLLLGASAHAQVKTPPVSAAPASLPLVLPSFAVAHDTLLARVGRVRTRAAAQQGYFYSNMGSLGGLHRRIKSYTSAPSSLISPEGAPAPGGLVKEQVIKHRFGIELEKLVYRDSRGRKVLIERYEGHQLMKQELLEYSYLFSKPVARWLFVHGDYLRYSAAPVSLTSKGKPSKRYFFSPRPAGV